MTWNNDRPKNAEMKSLRTQTAILTRAQVHTLSREWQFLSVIERYCSAGTTQHFHMEYRIYIATAWWQNANGLMVCARSCDHVPSVFYLPTICVCVCVRWDISMDFIIHAIIVVFVCMRRHDSMMRNDFVCTTPELTYRQTNGMPCNPSVSHSNSKLPVWAGGRIELVDAFGRFHGRWHVSPYLMLLSVLESRA